jgi:hypothetical protein
VLFCVMCVILRDVCCLYFIVLYCTVLYFPVLHCSTLPTGINPSAVNNNNILRFLTKASSVRLLSAIFKVVKRACVQLILINRHALNGIGPYIGKSKHYSHFFLFMVLDECVMLQASTE